MFVIVNMSTGCIASKTPVRARQQGLRLDGGLRCQLIIVYFRNGNRAVMLSVQTSVSIDWRCVTALEATAFNIKHHKANATDTQNCCLGAKF